MVVSQARVLWGYLLGTQRFVCYRRSVPLPSHTSRGLPIVYWYNIEHLLISAVPRHWMTPSPYFPFSFLLLYCTSCSVAHRYMSAAPLYLINWNNLFPKSWWGSSDQGWLKGKSIKKGKQQKESRWETNNNKYLSATCRSLRECRDRKDPKWYIGVLEVEWYKQWYITVWL